MDSHEKAKIRIEHWISHSEQHQEDYQAFADELKQMGEAESARFIKEMTALTAKSTECLRKALEALG